AAAQPTGTMVPEVPPAGAAVQLLGVTAVAARVAIEGARLPGVEAPARITLRADAQVRGAVVAGDTGKDA
ncbi:MAG: hypothetical protein K8R87_12900, partial [Verrucomicrobia bacterium]|nr:hypothetical protein [Verrucomicrobiota bacterium]